MLPLSYSLAPGLSVSTFRWLAIFLTLLAPYSASALLIATPGVSTEQPYSGFGGYRYVGALNGASGTYLQDGWVLTANHVGAGDFVLDGVPYSYVPGSEIRLETSPGQLADLLMFQIYPVPPNPPLRIRQPPPEVGGFLIMIGNGFDQGTPIEFDPWGPTIDPPSLNGWMWGTQKAVRWGVNRVHDYPKLSIRGTQTFRTQFDDRLLEGHATMGDSGGAILMYDGSSPGPELAGIMLSISLEWQQPYGSALLTNQTIIASIDVYRDQIKQNIAVPEPSGALPAGLAMLAVLSHVRRRQA